jgi:L-alanine-DL-glutamate epimerase-like enolase superfamily enzyme
MAHYIASTIKPYLIGKNPLHREAIWQGMWHYNRFWLTPVTALGAVDVALWDLYGKIVGRPVAEILGIYREKLPAYASSMTKPTIEAFVDEGSRARNVVIRASRSMRSEIPISISNFAQPRQRLSAIPMR